MNIKYIFYIVFFMLVFASCTHDSNLDSSRSDDGRRTMSVEFAVLDNGVGVAGEEEQIKQDRLIDNILVFGVAKDDKFTDHSGQAQKYNYSREELYYKDFRANSIVFNDYRKIWKVNPWQTSKKSANMFMVANLDISQFSSNPSLNGISDSHNTLPQGIESFTDFAFNNADINNFVKEGNSGPDFVAMNSQQVVQIDPILDNINYATANNGIDKSENVFKFELTRIVAKAQVRFKDNSVTNSQGIPLYLSNSSSFKAIAYLKNFKYMPCNMVHSTWLVKHNYSNSVNTSGYVNKDIFGDKYSQQFIKQGDPDADGRYAYAPKDVLEGKSGIDGQILANTSPGCYFFENTPPEESNQRTLFWGNVTYITVVAEFEPSLDRVWIRQSVNDPHITISNFKDGGAVDGSSNNDDSGMRSSAPANNPGAQGSNVENNKEDNTLSVGKDGWFHPKDMTELTDVLKNISGNNNTYIYYGLYDNYFYVNDRDASTFYDVKSKEHLELNQPYIVFQNFKCGYRIIPNPIGKDSELPVDFKLTGNYVKKADVVRNNAYVINILGASMMGFNYDGNNPNNPLLPKFEKAGDKPSDGVTPETPINKGVSPMLQTTLTVSRWGLVENEREFFWKNN